MVPRTFFSLIVTTMIATALPLAAQVAPRDGTHDFDSEIGNWTIHTRRLLHPLAHDNDWVRYDGTETVVSAWGGKANLAEVKEAGSAGQLNFIEVRLYDPSVQQWSLNFISAGIGTFRAPLAGGMRAGAMEFSGPDTFGGRNILVRFIARTKDADHAMSEQYFSDDGGQTWELNLINDYTRTKGETR